MCPPDRQACLTVSGLTPSSCICIHACCPLCPRTDRRICTMPCWTTRTVTSSGGSWGSATRPTLPCR